MPSSLKKETTLDIISKAIQSYRTAHNLTQAELSKLSGLNRATIGRIENGIFMPSIEQLQALASALDFDITTLFHPVAATTLSETEATHTLEKNLSRAKDLPDSKNQPTATPRKYTIAVAGTGYVGLSLAVLLAQHNHVIAVDIIPEKVDMINNRNMNQG